MKNLKVTVKSPTASISYDVFKTPRGAKGFGNKIASEAFYGEKVEIIIEAL